MIHDDTFIGGKSSNKNHRSRKKQNHIKNGSKMKKKHEERTKHHLRKKTQSWESIDISSKQYFTVVEKKNQCKEWLH